MPTGSNGHGKAPRGSSEVDFFCLKGRSLPTKKIPQVVRMEYMRKATPRQLAYIQHLKKREGKDSLEMDEQPNFLEASKTITELTEKSEPAGQIKGLKINEARLSMVMKECYRYFRRYEKDIHNKYRELFKQDVIKTYQLFTEIAQELGHGQSQIED